MQSTLSSNEGEASLASQLALVRRPLQSWYLLKWVHYRAHISHSKNLENRKPGNFLPNTYPTWVFHKKLQVKLINVLIIQIGRDIFPPYQTFCTFSRRHIFKAQTFDFNLHFHKASGLAMNTFFGLLRLEYVSVEILNWLSLSLSPRVELWIIFLWLAYRS